MTEILLNRMLGPTEPYTNTQLLIKMNNPPQV